MSEQHALYQIARLPITFSQRGNISMRALLTSLGYQDATALFTEEELLTVLTQHPVLVEAWYEYSADKRSSGWYVAPASAGQGYCVGRLGSPLSGLERTFSDRVAACAHFVLLEIREIVAAPTPPLHNG